MNDKQKQIEELTNIIMTIQTIYHEKASSEQIAQGIVNANYQKIPEGSVVLTQEEFNEFQEDSAKVKFLKKEIKKQAVKEVLDKVYDWGQDFFVEYTLMEEDEFNGILNEIVKEMGVEL